MGWALKQGEKGGGHSAATFVSNGFIPARFMGSGIADRSKGSGK